MYTFTIVDYAYDFENRDAKDAISSDLGGAGVGAVFHFSNFKREIVLSLFSLTTLTIIAETQSYVLRS